MIGRITNQGSTVSFQRLNAAAGANVERFNRQISSGRKFEHPSESPADTSLLLGGQRRLARIEQFTRNTSSANQWLAMTDQSMQTANEAITRARTLTVQGLNSGTGQLGADAAAAEIRQIREQLLSVANTTVSGRAIFGGTAGGPAYDASGAYLGDAGAVTRTIDTNEVVTINATGPEVFGASNPTDPINGSIFEKLGAIADALEAGDTTVAGQGLDGIDGSLNQLRSALGKVGAVANRVDMAQIRLGDEDLATRARISQTRDADMAEAIMGLRSAELGYEALMSTTARTMSRSLLDFMQ